MLTCIICHQSLEPDEFHRNIRRASGRDARCKQCKNQQQRERYAANPKPVLTRQREYRGAHQTEISKRMARWYAVNVEARRAYDKARYLRKKAEASHEKV